MDNTGNFYKEIIGRSPLAYAHHKVIFDDFGHGIDYIFLELNDAFTQTTGKTKEEIVNKKASEVFAHINPKKLQQWISFYSAVSLEQKVEEFEHYFEPDQKWYQVQVFSHQKGYFTTFFSDITPFKKNIKKLEDKDAKLQEQMEELRTLNEEYQTLNEEYITINEELNQTNREFEKALINVKEEKAQKQRILDSISDAIWTIDMNFNTTYISPAIEKIVGQKPEDYIKIPIDKKFPPPQLEEIMQIFEEELENEKSGLTPKDHSRIIEAQHYHANGSWVWISMHVSFLRNQDQDIIGFYGVTRNIEDRKKAEQKSREQTELLKSVTDNMFDLVALTDLEGNFTFVGKSHEILGYPLHELIGKNVTDFVHPDDKKSILKKFNEKDYFIHGKKVEYRYKKANGTYIWLETMGKFIANEWQQPESIIFSTRDITQQKQRENKIKESEKRFRLFAELSPVGIIISDENETPRYFSPKVKSMLGYDLNDFKSVDQWFDRVYPDKKLRDQIKKQWKKNIEQAQRQNKDIVPMECPVTCKNGEVKYIEFRLASDGESNFIILTDVTERKNAENAIRKSEQKYRLIFERSPLGVIHFDDKGIITDCNDHFAKILGSSKSKLIHLNMTLLPDQRIVEAIKNVLAGQSDYFEGEYTSFTSGKTTPLRILFSPVLNSKNEVEGGIALVEDRTIAIMQMNLEKRVSVAEESARFKQNFLANMSHEIRTPLTGIIGMIDIMNKTDLDQTQKDHLEIIRQSGDNLRQIINQVLDFSKIEAGKVQLQKKNFKTINLIQKTKNLFESIKKPGQSLNVIKDEKLPEKICADENRLLQVMNNLISNAVKFTPKGNIILTVENVTKEYKANDNRMIFKISITDQGRGIEPEMKKLLFTPFTQLDNNDTRKYEGTGLGLSISRELVHLHGGDMGVESEPGKGSTFWFTFIAEYCTEERVSEKVKRSVSSGEIPDKLNILIAEDKKVNQKVIKLMLESLGHHTEFVENGKEALDIYKDAKYHLIFMDIQMPVMDGITATQKLREKHKDLPPIVGLSANAFEGDREKYIQSGMDEYMTKPFKQSEFVALLKKLRT
ncbi:MAG: PAS domain S-box protein [Bacteroidota bacterium]